MKYKVLKQFKARTPDGEIELQLGQIITLPEEKAIKLLNEGKIYPIEKIAYKVYSEILGCYLWVVAGDQDIQELRTWGISEVTYTTEEVRLLKEIDKDSLKALHEFKEIFENSQIEQMLQKQEIDKTKEE